MLSPLRGLCVRNSIISQGLTPLAIDCRPFGAEAASITGIDRPFSTGGGDAESVE